MPQDNSHHRDRKLAWVAPASIAFALLLIIAGGLLFFDGREPVDAPAPAPPAAAPIAVPPPPPAPAVVKPAKRIDLIKAAEAAAARFADGDANPQGDKDPLVGRPFAIAIPFGCDGPQLGAGAAQAYYEFDPDQRTVRLVARPGEWLNLGTIQSVRGGAFEAVEGFWVPRPWRHSESCPERREQPVPAAPTPPAAPTLGIAQLFEPGGSRVARRAARPYESVLKLEKDKPLPLAEGYRLALEGRLAAFPTGEAVHCWSESPDHHPICIFAVAFTRVAFERSDGGIIAEWRD